MNIDYKEPYKMNLQLFAEKGDEAETTKPQGNDEFVYDENFFTGGKEDDTPDWLKDDEEVDETEKDDTTEEVEETTDKVDETEEVEKIPDEIKQSDKTNAAFADLRRQKKEFEKLQKANDAWAVRNFGDLGVKDFDSYRAMMDTQIQEIKIKDLEEKGYDVKAIKDAMSLDPQYKAMLDASESAVNESLETDGDVTEQSEEDLSPEEAQRVQTQYTALEKALPDFVTNPDDIQDEVWELYKKGVDLTTAFKVINEDKISKESTKKTKAAARQETLNKLNSKKHLKTEKESGSNASNDVYMDKETLSTYKSMGLTEKQAVKFHKQYMNQ